MNILVTGITGFIGRALTSRLSHKHRIIGVGRSSSAHIPLLSSYLPLDQLPEYTLELQETNKVRCVVHLAAAVHDMKGKLTYAQYSEANVDLTLDMCKFASQIGVKKFIFISTIKVLGESTSEGEKFNKDSLPNPVDDYSKSKFEAECVVRKYCADNGINYVIIRPVLVYGNTASGNLGLFSKLVKMGIPMPIKLIRNQRSLISIENLLSLIDRCAESDFANNKTFLAADEKPYSTIQIAESLSASAGRTGLFFSLRPQYLELLLNLVGFKKIADRILGNLAVDISYTTDTLGWRPIYNIFTTEKSTSDEWR